MKKSSHAFTLVELLVVIVIIAILAGIALPVFQKSQEKARAISDLSNLRQLGIGVQAFKGDNDGNLPDGKTNAGSQTWPQQMFTYVSSWKSFKSPFDTRALVDGSATSTTAVVSYGFNGKNGTGTGASTNGLLGADSSKFNFPSNLIMLAPKQDAATTVKFSGTSATDLVVLPAESGGSLTLPRGTHLTRARINVVFADGHSEDIPFVKFIDDSKPSASGGGKMRWIYDDSGA